ncbi:MAG: hypothetical protein IH988_00145 [Planctomycetes bacterium]|nr:hypothetical protein [Planctomycetota bacterium]
MWYAIKSGLLVTILASGVSQAATLSLRNAADGSATLSMAEGETAVVEIVLELDEGEEMAFSNVFLDGLVVSGSGGVVEVLDFMSGLEEEFTYDRDAMPDDNPYAELAGILFDEYGLIMGGGVVSGPAAVVLDEILIHALSVGEVELTFEESPRGPALFDPAFVQYVIAPTTFDPGMEGFLYLGAGDGREGGAGPFLITTDGDVVEPPPANGNGNDSTPPVDNENDNDDVIIDNGNDNGSEANDNVPEVNDNVPDVPNSEDPEVTISEDEGDLLGVIDDGLTEVAVFVDRDDDGNPIAINGLVVEADGDAAKLFIHEGRLTVIEGDEEEQIIVTYNEAARTVMLTAPGSGDSATVSFSADVDLAASPGGDAVPGETDAEAMERLLDELGAFMSPIIVALGDDASTRGLLDAVGGIELLEYVFLGPAEASVDDALENDRIDESGNFGDSSIDDPLDDLVGLTEDDNAEPVDPPRPTGSGGGGICGLGMLVASGLTFAGLTLLRPRRRSTS